MDEINKLTISTGDDNFVAQVVDTFINLDTIVQELLESRGIKDTIISGSSAIDSEFVSGSFFSFVNALCG